MAPPPQRRNATHTRPSAQAPMSERQQMALLMQMTSSSEAGMSFTIIILMNVGNKLQKLIFKQF